MEEVETVEETTTETGEVEGAETTTSKTEPPAPTLTDQEKKYIKAGQRSEVTSVIEQALKKYPEAHRSREGLDKLADRLIDSGASPTKIEERIYADARREDQRVKVLKD